MKEGADIYASKHNNTSAKFATITFQELMCLMHFKEAFFQMDMDKASQAMYAKVVSAVGKCVELYGKLAPATLYRGIGDEELDYIKDAFSTSKVVVFDRIKSFSTDNVAVYDFGDNLMTLSAGRKKLLDYNSFLISIGIVRLLSGKCDEDEVLMFMDGYDSEEMDEFIVPAGSKYRVVDLDELKFKLV